MPKGIVKTEKIGDAWLKALIMKLIEACKSEIDPKKSCGEDGIHPAVIKEAFKKGIPNAEKIALDAIERPNALRSRLTLITKKD